MDVIVATRDSQNKQAQWLSVIAVLPKDLDSIPSNEKKQSVGAVRNGVLCG